MDTSRNSSFLEQFLEQLAQIPCLELDTKAIYDAVVLFFNSKKEEE